MTLAVAIFLITYAFIASEKVDKSVAAVLGATLMILTGQIHYLEALAKVDLNVVFVLVGMMIVVNILASTGMFEWLAIVIAQRARGDGVKILVALCLVTATLSAFLDNVTTVIILAPVAILVTQLLELPTAPLLILLAIFSNIGGTGTLIGDPPNIIIGSQTHLGFNDFLIHLGPAAFLLGGLLAVLVFVFYGRMYRVAEGVKSRLDLADARAAIIHPVRLRAALVVTATIFAGFFVGHSIGLETGLVALAGGFLMALACRVDVHHALAKVEWGTILFFIGLFMLVGGLEERGVFEALGHHLVEITGGNLLFTALAVLWASLVFSAIVDNIPLVIAFIPILKAVIPTFALSAGLEPESAEAVRTIANPLYWALALGACLGGNGSLIGASANVVVANIAARNRCHISFLDFTRAGAPITLLSGVVSSLYLWLRYFPSGP
jgi:Na+/H+ antiporter NhaD/arsenite permease-like protein